MLSPQLLKGRCFGISFPLVSSDGSMRAVETTLGLAEASSTGAQGKGEF